jgi:hypothetical protein
MRSKSSWTLLDEVADDQVALGERAQECGFGGGAEAVSRDHVTDLGDDGGRHDERTGHGLQQS